jgi:hypothetical protein
MEIRGMHDRRPALKLRLLLAGLVVAYGLALYVQWHPPFLSDEAKQYEQISWEVLRGPDLRYFVQKLIWLTGNVVGAIGIIMLFFRHRRGAALLLASPPFLLAATVYGAAGTAFPHVEILLATLLWLVTAAIWGSVVTLALVEDGTRQPAPPPSLAMPDRLSP